MYLIRNLPELIPLILEVYDNTLAGLIGGIFPGRSNLIVGRDDLANAKRAATKGYGYRFASVYPFPTAPESPAPIHSP